jgi:hypothetical protein
MKWLPLKIYQSQLLIHEVEAVKSKYENLINQVRCQPDDENIRNEFLCFREEIEQRIIDLDEFYNLNISDSRIGAFEKIRNKLSMLLETNIESGNEITKKAHNYEKSPEIKKDNPPIKFGLNKKSGIEKKSKLMNSSASMRQSKIRQSSNSKFLGEQVGNWKEVVFKIRLTENEYKLLLQEKSKDVLKI